MSLETGLRGIPALWTCFADGLVHKHTYAASLPPQGKLCRQSLALSLALANVPGRALGRGSALGRVFLFRPPRPRMLAGMRSCWCVCPSGWGERCLHGSSAKDSLILWVRPASPADANFGSSELCGQLVCHGNRKWTQATRGWRAKTHWLLGGVLDHKAHP